MLEILFNMKLGKLVIKLGRYLGLNQFLADNFNGCILNNLIKLQVGYWVATQLSKVLSQIMLHASIDYVLDVIWLL